MKQSPHSSHALRRRFFILSVCVLTLILLIRIAYLQLIKHQFYKHKSETQVKRIIKLYSKRGHIFDRNKQPLALTQKAYSVYALPKQIENKWVFAKKIAGILNVPRKEISDMLYQTKAPFVWIKRQCNIETSLALKKLNLKGIGFIQTEKRVYPEPTLASPILGFVGIDNQGLGGLEYKYDKELKGTSGKIILEGDPRGKQLLSGKRKLKPPFDGQHIYTTIDRYTQFIAQYYLEKGVLENQAKSGSVIVMDPKTGDIHAMASFPHFNNNQWQLAPRESKKNPCVTDVYEPGSIFKIITLASVLEEEIVSPKTTLYVPETLTLYNRTITEAHPRKEGDPDSLSVSEIIQQSLNVGTSLLAIKLGEERFYKYIQSFGFGKRTDIQLPGESKGLLRPLQNWSGVDIATISFGQGIAVTPIQMISAVATIANEGVYVKPRVIHYFSDPKHDSQKTVPIQKKGPIISKKTAAQVSDILEKVVQRGTGKPAAIPGYKIAGKTGTSQKARADGKGYAAGEYIASFIGFFPVSDPKFLIYVTVDTPKKSIWGSSVAAPIFRNIALGLIDYANIKPEKYTKRQKRTKLSSDDLSLVN